MSQAIKEKSSYREAFEGAAREGEPAWLARLREGALGRFEESGFPTTDQEDWKYTSVAPIARAEFRPAREAPEVGEEAVKRFVYAEAARSRLVFVNGAFRPELSSFEDVPEGVTACDLGAALRGEHAEVLRERLEDSAGREANAFESLNAAFTGSGAFVFVPRGVRAVSPLQLLFLSAGDDRQAATFPRVVIVAERESELTLIENYASAGQSAYLTDALVEVFVGDGARVTHYKVQDEGAEGFHVASTRAELGRDSFYDLTTVTLGARLSRHDIEVSLAREGAECHVDGLYVVGDGQHADTHSLIDHARSHCTSRQNYKGILDGRSRAVFNGRVFVHRDAQQTDAQQSNKNLLLSTDARVDTKPQLEIYADDVKCAHGATVGQLEEEELFYLLSRGLHPDLARNLLTYGFAEEIVEKIKFDSIRAQLDEAILNRLRARLEV